MLVENESLENKLNLAMKSRDTNILTQLLVEPSSKIRRALARNVHTPRSVINVLAYDPVLNVAYKALQNSNCTIKRCISDTDHPCVCCDVAEDVKSCDSCKSGMFC